MKAILCFRLPQEQIEHNDALKGSTYHCAINDIMNVIRSKIKYQENSKEVDAIYQDLRQDFIDILQDYNIEW